MSEALPVTPVGLNGKEKRVYQYIAEIIDARGYAPSVRDIKDALGYKSTSTVQMYLDRLIIKGVLVREDGKSRTVRLGEAGASDGVFSVSVGEDNEILGVLRGDILTLTREREAREGEACALYDRERNRWIVGVAARDEQGDLSFKNGCKTVAIDGEFSPVLLKKLSREYSIDD